MRQFHLQTLWPALGAGANEHSGYWPALGVHCHRAVIVKAVARNRGPASEAQFLYEETEDSARKRETVSARLKLERPPEFDLPGRPSKKDRRAIQRFTKRGW